MTIRFICLYTLFSLLFVVQTYAACPSGTTEGIQITCNYLNGNDLGQFQVCLSNGAPYCAYGIAYPGVPGTPEPFNGCEGSYNGIAYCGVPGTDTTPTPAPPSNPTSTPSPTPTREPVGCNVGSYVQSVNANGNLANEDSKVIGLFKKNIDGVSPLWVKTKKESNANAIILKRAIKSAFKIVSKGEPPKVLTDQLSNFSLDALSSLPKKCTGNVKTLANAIAKEALKISAAMVVHGSTCNGDSLRSLARSVCNKK